MKPWANWWTMPVLIFAGMVGPGLAAAPPAAADPIVDLAFLETLDERGIEYDRPATAFAAAELVCQYLDAGHTFLQTVAYVVRESQLGSDSGYFIGASVSAYCDEYVWMFDGAGVVA